MTWADWGELIKVIAICLTAATAIVGAIIAVRGLTKWQAEMIGERRSELAEEVLAGFYEARDRVDAIRSPVGYLLESEDRKPVGHESEQMKRERDAAFVPMARYDRHREFFGSLFAKRYRLRALLGPRLHASADAPFDELQSCLAKILASADMLMRTAGREASERQPEGRPDWEAAIYRGSDDDKIAKRMDAAVLSLERLCEPILEGRPHPKKTRFSPFA